MFNSELEFEKAVIEHLIEHGWEKNVLKNKTPEQSSLLERPNFAQYPIARELLYRHSFNS